MKLSDRQTALLLEVHAQGPHDRVTGWPSAKALAARDLVRVQWVGMSFYKIAITAKGRAVAATLQGGAGV